VRLPHPWPAVIVALVATNLVTAAALILWSEGRTADIARWAANREKMADLSDLVFALAGLAERLTTGLNETIPDWAERGDAIAAAIGPATAIVGRAGDLAESYREAELAVRAVWTGVADLGRTGRFFAAISWNVSSAGTMSAYDQMALENITRIASALGSILLPAGWGFDAGAPLDAFSVEPLARLSAADVATARALADQATCLYDQVYFRQPLGPCG